MIALAGGIVRDISRYRNWMAFLVGAAMVLSFAPFEIGWLAPILLAVLWWLWEDSTPRQAAWSGFCFGFGLFSVGTWWFYITLNILGGLWPPVALFMMLCLIAAMGAFIAAMGWLIVTLSPSGSLLRLIVVAPAIWTVLEWLRGWILNGFPWLSIGYGQPESLFGAAAPLAGVYGVTWVVCLAAGLIVLLLRADLRTCVTAPVLGALLFAALWWSGQQSWTQVAGDPLRVTLVQGAIPQELKWRADQLEPTLERYARLSLAQENQDLIVWPEVAIPALPFEVQDFLTEMHDQMVERDTQLFAGILTFDMAQGQYLNTLWAIGTEEGTYNKRHLVPFGEFFPVPDFVKDWLRLLSLPSQDIAHGADDQPLLSANGVPVAATICFEIAFGSEQLRFLPEAQLLVNVSNDAWFGDSFAPHQHLQMGQMRSRETGRYLLRATNTGITAIVTPEGNIAARIAQFEPGVLAGVVEPRSGATPYVRFGNALIVSLCGLLIAAGGWFGRRASG